MSASKILTQLQRFFSRKLKRQEEKRKHLKALLKKLKKEEHALRDALHATWGEAPPASPPPHTPTAPSTSSGAEPPPTPTQLHQQRQWAVVRAQRKKGLALLKALRK